MNLDHLTAQLMDEDADVRYDAAREIAWNEKPPFERILEWARDPHPRMRTMAYFILGCRGYTDSAKTTTATVYPQAIPNLLEALADPGEEVRAAAVIALGEHGVPDTLSAIIPLESDSSAEVRFAMTRAFCTFPTSDDACRQFDSQIEATLLRLMNDEDEDVRDWATFAIHVRGYDNPTTRERLWKALDDPNPDVRGEAAQGLAKFGDCSFLPRLERLLREEVELSPCYFLAAQEFGDPALLPTVLEAARRWREEDHEMNWFIEPTIQALRDKIRDDNDQSEVPGC